MQHKKIIIKEEVISKLKDYYNITNFKFKASIKKFLANLLQDPINAQPDELLQFNGLDKNTLINHLIDNKIIIKKMTIDDHNPDGTSHKAKMLVKYNVPKNRFNDRLDTLFETLFSNRKQELNEDGGGATSCSGVDGNGTGSGMFLQPLFGYKIRKGRKKKEKIIK